MHSPDCTKRQNFEQQRRRETMVNPASTIRDASLLLLVLSPPLFYNALNLHSGSCRLEARAYVLVWQCAVANESKVRPEVAWQVACLPRQERVRVARVDPERIRVDLRKRRDVKVNILIPLRGINLDVIDRLVISSRTEPRRGQVACMRVRYSEKLLLINELSYQRQKGTHGHVDTEE
eukprot:842208-Pleurochrysis_carterae.AAC.2